MKGDNEEKIRKVLKNEDEEIEMLQKRLFRYYPQPPNEKQME